MLFTLVLLFLPSMALAEVGAVAFGSSTAEVPAETLQDIVVEALRARGIEVVPEAEVLAVTDGALTAEPLPSSLETWAAELEAEALVAAYAEDGEGDVISVRVTVYRTNVARTLSGSTTCQPDGIGQALSNLLVSLLVDSDAPNDVAEPEADDMDGSSSDTGESEVDEPQSDAESDIVPIADLPEVDEAAPPPPPPENQRRSGRVPFILNSTALGLSLMAGVLFAADVEDPRLFAPILLVGGAGGLTAAMLIERRWSVSRGDNSIIATGGWYGAATGVLVAGAAGFQDVRWLVTGGLIGQIVGLSAGIVTSVYTEISVNDGAVIHSGAIWGLGAGGVLATLVWHSDRRASYGLILTGLVAGLGVGALVSRFVDVSAGRVVVVDLCGLLGVLLGASVGIPIIIDSQSSGHLRAYAGILLGAAAAGIGIGVLLTRRWDETRDRRRPSRRERRRRQNRGGEMSFVPVPTVIPPAEAIAGARATLGVQLLGGTW